LEAELLRLADGLGHVHRDYVLVITGNRPRVGVLSRAGL